MKLFPIRYHGGCYGQLGVEDRGVSLKNRNKEGRWRIVSNGLRDIFVDKITKRITTTKKKTYIASVDTFDNASVIRATIPSSLVNRYCCASLAIAGSVKKLSLFDPWGKADGKGSSGNKSVKLKTAPSDWIGILLMSFILPWNKLTNASLKFTIKLLMQCTHGNK